MTSKNLRFSTLNIANFGVILVVDALTYAVHSRVSPQRLINFYTFCAELAQEFNVFWIGATSQREIFINEWENWKSVNK